MLVYVYMSNGSLASHLYGSKSSFFFFLFLSEKNKINREHLGDLTLLHKKKKFLRPKRSNKMFKDV